MGYIQDYLLSVIKHYYVASFIDDKVLRQSIWYSATKDSYAQRNCTFDSSWLSSPRSDAVVLSALKTAFKLDYIKAFDKQEECNRYIDSLGAEKTSDSFLLFYQSSGQSAFMAYVEGIRNSLAHGTFNRIGNRTFFMSQHRSQPKSPLKFLLQSKTNCSFAIQQTGELFARFVTGDAVAAKYDCIMHEYELLKVGDYYYSKIKNCYIVVDDSFKFSSEKHVKDLQSYIKSFSFNDKAVLLVDEDLGRISLRNRSSEDGKVVVVQQSKLTEHFNSR